MGRKGQGQGAFPESRVHKVNPVSRDYLLPPPQSTQVTQHRKTECPENTVSTETPEHGLGVSRTYDRQMGRDVVGRDHRAEGHPEAESLQALSFESKALVGGRETWVGPI